MKVLPIVIGVLVVPDVLSVNEGPAPDVQPRQPDIEPVRQQRPVGEVLGEPPVDQAIVVARNQAPVFQHLGEISMQHKALRWRREAFGHRTQLVERNRRARRLARQRLRRRTARQRRRDGAVWRLCLHRRERFGTERLGQLFAGHSPARELFGVEADDAAMALDPALHCRLCDRRIIPDEVPVATVADVVDDDVCTERRAEACRQARREDDGIGIVGVDVNDRRIDGSRDVCTGQCRARIAWMRNGRADLVVQDQMQRAANAVTARLRKVERLGHDALGGKRSIAVHQNRHHLPGGSVGLAVL